MESIVLIIVGVIALAVILYMTVSESKPGCQNNTGNCSSCSLYRSCDQYPSDSDEEQKKANEDQNECKP